MQYIHFHALAVTTFDIEQARILVTLLTYNPETSSSNLSAITGYPDVFLFFLSDI
jgi:hypothetical protein